MKIPTSLLDNHQRQRQKSLVDDAVFLRHDYISSQPEAWSAKKNKKSNQSRSIKLIIMTKLCHPTPLFGSPKRGGILQSSGFLDLKSLLALSQTAQAHAYDELSLIQWIENEITRFHGAHSVEEAITFLKKVFCKDDWFRQWLERESAAESITKLTRETMSVVMPYEVMLAKLLQTIPTESERLRLANETWPE